tara:strand:+ start:9807 stop:10004 length:198 start_codon:yes stop_codon:yes gene_type:complete
METKLSYILITVLVGGGITWTTWVTMKLTKLHISIKYLNDNLFLVDWDKLPKKSLNEVFNKQQQQ